jgi:prophage regulatory protein
MEVMLRCGEVAARLGKGRSAIYEDGKHELLTPGVKLGARSVGWPESEIAALLNARISGATEQQLKTLVRRLVAERANRMPKF